MEQDELHALALAEVDAVYRLAYHLPGDSRDADDLVLETFRTALASRADLEPTAQAVRRFLFRLLYDAVLHRSHAQPAPPVRTEATHPRMAAPDSGHPPTPANEHWQNERLTYAIRALPLAHRAAFLFCMVEELKYREAAAVMGLHADNVRVLLIEARAALSAQLAQPLPAGLEGADVPKRETDRDPEVME